MANVYDRLVKDGVDSNKTIRVTMYRHKKDFDKGKQYIWNMGREFKTMNQLLALLAAEIIGATGPTRKVYDLFGNEIVSLDQLQDGGSYVCVGGESFTDAGIPPAALGKPVGASAKGAPVPTHGSPEVKGRVIGEQEAERIKDEDIRKQQTIVCYFYGAKSQTRPNHKGARMIINRTKYRTLDQLIGDVSGKVPLVVGGIQRIYSIHGSPVKSVDDLEDQQKYICSIAKPFSDALVPDVAKKAPPTA